MYCDRNDSLGQVKSGKKYWADGTPVAGQQFEYGFDDIGNRTATKAGGNENGANLRSASYTPNLLNQYTSRTVPGAVDIMGVSFATNTVTVNGQAAYRKGEYFRKELPIANTSGPVWTNITVSATGQGSTNGYAFLPRTPEQFWYDTDGNLTNDGRWKYTWDAENRLVRMISGTTTGPQQRLDFGYDLQSRRITKKVWNNTAGSGTPALDERFVYDGWNLAAELNATNNAVVRGYVWGLDLSGSMQGAGGVGGLLAVGDPASGTNFCCFDGNGNVSVLVSATNAFTTAQYEYGPFGEVLRATGPMAKASPFRFSTRYQDDESDLLYYGYRYYNASTGRWLSRDPADEDEGGPNLYGFVMNAPVNGTDELGLALYVSDGTWMSAPKYANPWQLYNDTSEPGSKYWGGPGLLGLDTWSIAWQVYNSIQDDFCAAKKAGTNLTINLAGWSRGAMISVRVANMLNDLGCWCFECGTLNHYKPVEVNWVGAFDAVRRQKDSYNWPSKVPSNVAHFDHAVKTKRTGAYQRLMETVHFTGGNELSFDNFDGTKSTHADIGMSVVNGNINGAYPWIKSQGIAAGVHFR